MKTTTLSTLIVHILPKRRLLGWFGLRLINKKLLVHEGEIELRNQEFDQTNKILQESELSDGSKGNRKSKYVSKSAIWNTANTSAENKIKMMWKNNIKSDAHQDEYEEEKQEEENASESSFSLKKPSLVEFYLKTQSWNFRRLNLKVVGFKTYFNKYIEDIEVYAEPIEDEINDLRETTDHDFLSANHN